MYCAVIAYPLPQGVVFWRANVVSFAAPRGAMNQSMPVLTTIIASAKMQLKWVNACAQVRQMMMQNIANSIAQQGQLSRYISQVSDEISDTSRQIYQEQEQVEDKVAQEWHEYMMGETPPDRAVE